MIKWGVDYHDPDGAIFNLRRMLYQAVTMEMDFSTNAIQEITAFDVYLWPGGYVTLRLKNVSRLDRDQYFSRSELENNYYLVSDDFGHTEIITCRGGQFVSTGFTRSEWEAMILLKKFAEIFQSVETLTDRFLEAIQPEIKAIGERCNE